MNKFQKLWSNTESISICMNQIISQLSMMKIKEQDLYIYKRRNDITVYYHGIPIFICDNFNNNKGISYTCKWDNSLGYKLYMWLTGCIVLENDEDTKITLLKKRVEISPHYDLWMSGCKYGTVIQVFHQEAKVKMDNNKEYYFPFEHLTVC